MCCIIGFIAFLIWLGIYNVCTHNPLWLWILQSVPLTCHTYYRVAHLTCQRKGVFYIPWQENAPQISESGKAWKQRPWLVETITHLWWDCQKIVWWPKVWLPNETEYSCCDFVVHNISYYYLLYICIHSRTFNLPWLLQAEHFTSSSCFSLARSCCVPLQMLQTVGIRSWIKQI